MKSTPIEETANTVGLKPGVILTLEEITDSPHQGMKEHSNTKSWSELCKSSVGI